MPSHPKCGATVISVGAIPELLSLRAAILQSEGYAVFTTTNASEAVEQIRNGHCGVLLLCYSVSDKARQQLIHEFRESCADGRIVAITNRPIAETPKEVDALVYGIEGPEMLIEAISRKAA